MTIDLGEVGRWAVAAAAFVMVALLVVVVAPARVRVKIDTPKLVFDVSVALLWGMLPSIRVGAGKRPARKVRSWLSAMSRVHRVGYAVVTTGYVMEAFKLIGNVLAKSEFELVEGRTSVGLAGPIGTMAAGIAPYVYALLPALKDKLVVEARPTPGLDIVGTADLRISPMALYGAWRAFQESPAVRDFKRKINR